jgi:hypothetical protein
VHLGDEVAWVLHHDVGAEVERAGARLGRPQLAAGDDPRPRLQRAQGAQHLDHAVEHTRGGGGERHHVGLLGLHERRDVLRRRAGAEQDHLPAVGLEEVRHHAGAERVQLVGCPGDDRQPPVLRRPRQLAAQAVEDRLGDRGGVVLLGDVDGAHRPAVADLAHRRLEDLEVDVGDRDAVLERPLDRLPCARGIATQQRVQKRRPILVETHERQDASFKTGRKAVAVRPDRPVRFNP